MKTSHIHRFQDGFTLIELLVVMAIIGILASAVIIAINPLQQIASAQDSNRTTAIVELAKGVETYATKGNGYLPQSSTSDWIDKLVADDSMKIVPAAPDAISGYSYPCNNDASLNGNAENRYCYLTNSDNSAAWVFTQLESGNYTKLCSTQPPYYVYMTAKGSTCVVCGSVTTSTTPSACVSQ